MRGIPVLQVEGDSIARAWENSLIALHQKGCDLHTQYDKPGDPPSKDATMIVTITDPLNDPMIHRDFPGGLEDLQEYTMEVCEGIKDHLVRKADDSGDTRWEYTYHQRLFGYEVPSLTPFRSFAASAELSAAASVWRAFSPFSCAAFSILPALSSQKLSTASF